jgi:hypothetical protein
MQAVRLGNWKFVRELGGPTELYDLQSDPSESHDVAAKNSAVVQSIEFMLQTIHDPPVSRVMTYKQQKRIEKHRKHHHDDDDDD